MIFYLKYYLLLSIVWTLSGLFAHAQSDQADFQQVKGAVEQMFDGMREGDSSKVREVMNENVIFQSTAIREGKPVLSNGSLERFLNAVGTPHDDIWDERIFNLKIEVDGPLATAWMDYSFYLGDKFSHCGVNAMTLFKSSDGWKIIYLVDTRRKENCSE